jgi:acyl carrier protein
MGLDAVEIVMKVEETFDIAIADSEAEKIVTPGQLIDLIQSKVERTDHAACLTQRAFYRLRASLVRQLGVHRSKIKLETSLATLFPRPNRRTNFHAVAADIGVTKEIGFVRPGWLIILIVAATVICWMIVLTSLASRPVSAGSILTNVLSPGIFALCFAALFCLSALYATRWMRIEFKSPVIDVAHLSRWIVAHAPYVVQAPPGQWHRTQIAELTRAIVIENLGCEKQYREDANFVKDLGLS